MFNVRDNKWEPGFRIGLTDAPSRREMVNNAPLENPYFPGLAGHVRTGRLSYSTPAEH